MRIEPFLTESKDGGFGSSDNFRVTSFYGVVSYFTHTVEPLFPAKKANQDFVDDAFRRLERCPKEDLNKMFEEFNRDIDMKKKDEEGWKEYCDWEDEAIKIVEQADDWVSF